MATKPDLKLGEKINEPQERDAIHIAVLPVRVVNDCIPGQHVVGFVFDDYVSPAAKKHIGVIDPFLKETALYGEKVWLFLYPNTITSLRHDAWRRMLVFHSRNLSKLFRIT